MKNKSLVAVALLILVVLFAGVIYFYKSAETKKSDEVASLNSAQIPFVRDYSPSFGDNAKGIYVVEYIDPECESCAAFNPIMKSFYKEYYKDIKLVIRYLDNHKNSNYAIKILEASRQQNKYLEVLDVIFNTQGIWAQHNNEKPELLMGLLEQVNGLDIEKLKTNMQNPEFDKRINLDRVDATMLYVRGTPTVFINGKKLERLSADSLENLYISEAFK